MHRLERLVADERGESKTSGSLCAMIATVVNDTARTAPWLIDLAPLEAMVILEPPILIAFLTARWNAFLAAANMVCDSINDLVERRNGFRVLSDEKGPYSVDWVSREREGLICKTHKGNDCGDGRKREGVRCETHGGIRGMGDDANRYANNATLSSTESPTNTPAQTNIIGKSHHSR